MNIFITNDDGIDALGIRMLAKAMRRFGQVYVVAPDKEYSGMSRSISIKKPLIAKLHDMGDSINAYSLSGSPTDCVKIGIEGIFSEVKFDLLISGINRGPNLGTDVFYSGTVSAALEGLYQNINSIAVSFCSFHDNEEDYEKICDKFEEFIKEYLTKRNHIGNFILNINFPHDIENAHEFAITSLGRRDYENVIAKKVIKEGVFEYIIGGEPILEEEASHSDVWMIRENKITVTPVYNSLYSHLHFEYLKKNW
ncbi:5'-nucleotidase [Acetoanaerobium pronyense]|uniref:5'-nucleotidase SurE n=1 Tax=Acetoanaerobium pronyense TaxID=1482736 RepID=A0ABS4KIU1_9FIRM|nr:5'/3'-nucleotidase SurE [Acetoanaerobium pronyense]MBP2027701.1 5'-nucleotidase [Acetoanaerobium pronyense]